MKVSDFIGTVVSAEVQVGDCPPDIDFISLTFDDGRVVLIGSIGDWGNESWVRVNVTQAKGEES
jgi:hypothetical protein